MKKGKNINSLFMSKNMNKGFKGSLATATAFLALLFILPICFAQSIDSYAVKFTVIGSKTVASYEINLSEAAVIQFELPLDAEAIDIYIDGKKQNISDISRAKILQLSASRSIKISYVTEKFVEQGKKNYFLTDISFPLNVNSLDIELILPTGAVLDAPSSAWPAPSQITSDGQHIILNWEGTNLKKDSSFAIFVIFRKSSTLNWLNWFFLAIGIVAIFAVAFFFFISRKKVKKEIDKHLLDSERMIISCLRKAKGELWQKQLQIKTGFSKAKLSRTIRNLETRGLIKKLPYGNTNKIRIV